MATTTVNRPVPSYLRLHVADDGTHSVPQVSPDGAFSWGGLRAAFQRATGWTLGEFPDSGLGAIAQSQPLTPDWSSDLFDEGWEHSHWDPLPGTHDTGVHRTIPHESAQPLAEAIGQLVAGQIATQLEREILLRECDRLRKEGHGQATSRSWPAEGLTRAAPLIEDWDVSARRTAPGDLCEWFVHERGALSVSLAFAHRKGLAGAITAATLGGALRGLREDMEDPGRLLERINQVLWTGSAGDEWCSLVHAVIDPKSGVVKLAAAGPISAFLLQSGGVETISTSTMALGIDPTRAYRATRHRITPGDVLLVVGGGRDVEPHEAAAYQARAAEGAARLFRSINLAAQELVGLWPDDESIAADLEVFRPSLLVVKRNA